MNRELLEKPFEPAQIKQRKGRNGMLDYVEGHTVIARLNDAFDGNWSFEIVRHDIFEERDEILVLGKLSADGVVKMQFDESQITRDKETKEIISLGDDLKAAGTDALKKCATFLGVGLHLYGERSGSAELSRGASTSTQRVPGQGGDGRRGGGSPARRNRRPQPPVSPPATPDTRAVPGQERAEQGTPPEKSGPAPAQAARQAGNGRLDNAQHSAILALAKKRGLSQVELNQESVKRYGVQVPYLTYRDAAHLIGELQATS